MFLSVGIISNDISVGAMTDNVVYGWWMVGYVSSKWVFTLNSNAFSLYSLFFDGSFFWGTSTNLLQKSDYINRGQNFDEGMLSMKTVNHGCTHKTT